MPFTYLAKRQNMQWADRIGRRIKLRDLHLLHAVAHAAAWPITVVTDGWRRCRPLIGTFETCMDDTRRSAYEARAILSRISLEAGFDQRWGKRPAACG